MQGDPSHIAEFDQDYILSRYDRQNRLLAFYRLLLEENKKINLVSRETSEDDLRRMSAESLLPLDVLPADAAHGSYLDIGAGGGFPFVPILLSGQPGYSLAAERTLKKAGALERILEQMDLKAEVVAKTVEEIKFSRKFDLITQRYVKLTPQLLNRAVSLLTSKGVLIYYGLPAFNVTGCEIVRYRFRVADDQPHKHICLIRQK